MESTMPMPETVEIRALTPSDIGWALRAGWEDFGDRRGDLLVLPIIYPLVGFLLSALAFQQDLFQLIFPLAAGFALVGPITAAGFYELARRRENGEDTAWRHFLDPLRRPSRMTLLALALMLAILFVAWISAAAIIHDGTLGRLAPATPSAFLAALFSTPEGRQMVLSGNLVGGAFALVSLVISAFSFPMAVDRTVDPLTAVMTSVRVFLKNPIVVLTWGLVVALLLLAASIPLFVGLAVVLPWLGYATWHLYTRAVVR